MLASEIVPSLYCSYISVLQSADRAIISKELGTGNRLQSLFFDRSACQRKPTQRGLAWEIELADPERCPRTLDPRLCGYDGTYASSTAMRRRLFTWPLRPPAATA